MKFSENPAVSSSSPTPTAFYSQMLWGIYLLGNGNLGCVVWPGAGMAQSQGIHPDFYLPHVHVGPPVPIPPLPQPLHATLCLLTSLPCLSISALPTHLDECGFLNPWLWDFYTAWFSDSSGCYLFWDLVVIPFCGCARRWSVSTYASILTRSQDVDWFKRQF